MCGIVSLTSLICNMRIDLHADVPQELMDITWLPPQTITFPVPATTTPSGTIVEARMSFRTSHCKRAPSDPSKITMETRLLPAIDMRLHPFLYSENLKVFVATKAFRVAVKTHVGTFTLYCNSSPSRLPVKPTYPLDGHSRNTSIANRHDAQSFKGCEKGKA